MRAPTWAADLADLLLPAGCVACGSWIPGGRGAPLVCGRCRSRLRPAPWPRCPRCHLPSGTGRRPSTACHECRTWPAELTAARYAYVMAPPADRLVYALKYGGWPELAEAMGRALCALSLPERHGRRCVVAVPTTPARLRERGYNQAGLLARVVSERRGWPLAPALRRLGSARTQVSLGPAQRHANVRDAFTVERSEAGALRGADVVLVDDVLTTGATACAAAAALVRAGASAVTLVTYARAIPFAESAERRRRSA